VYQITSMLLSHQAKPDEAIRHYTARQLARKHPDPRVRRLLATVAPPLAQVSNGADWEIGSRSEYSVWGGFVDAEPPTNLPPRNF
jgi:hypothetical protein